MPRAAVLSLHARIENTGPDDWAHPELVQVWGPRHSVFAVPAEDVAAFALGASQLRAPRGGGRKRLRTGSNGSSQDGG